MLTDKGIAYAAPFLRSLDTVEARALELLGEDKLLMLTGLLAGFSDQAVTALGLYYKWQTFFFIPLGAMQTCIVPVISFNYAAGNIDRCKRMLTAAIGFGLALMAVGTACFAAIPVQMLRVFTVDALVIEIGRIGFRFIGLSFPPMVTSLIFPVFFQAVGSSLKSSLLTIIRTVVLFVPLGFLFSRFGLNWFWLTFPVTELLTSAVGAVYYRQFLTRNDTGKERPIATDAGKAAVLKLSKPGVIITIAREHGSAGKQIGKLAAQKLGVPFYYKEMIALAGYSFTRQKITGSAGSWRSTATRRRRQNEISGCRWGDARHYELTVDSSAGIDKTVETILRYAADARE